MKVPKGRKVMIGNKIYKPGDELPASYTLPEKKNKPQPTKTEAEKK